MYNTEDYNIITINKYKAYILYENGKPIKLINKIELHELEEKGLHIKGIELKEEYKDEFLSLMGVQENKLVYFNTTMRDLRLEELTKYIK